MFFCHFSGGTDSLNDTVIIEEKWIFGQFLHAKC